MFDKMFIMWNRSITAIGMQRLGVLKRKTAPVTENFFLSFTIEIPAEEYCYQSVKFSLKKPQGLFFVTTGLRSKVQTQHSPLINLN